MVGAADDWTNICAYLSAMWNKFIMNYGIKTSLYQLMKRKRLYSDSRIRVAERVIFA